MVTGGSIAVRNPEIFIGWLEKYGPDKIILGADVKGDKISISGWLEDSDKTWKSFISDYRSQGIEKVISTDISRDGMLQGPATDLYIEMLNAFPDLYLIASGGISNLTDIEKLDEAGIPAVIFGKAIYEGRIKLKDLQKFID